MSDFDLHIPDEQWFFGLLDELGIISPPDQKVLVRLGRCLSKVGPAIGISTALYAGAGTVVVPGFGTVSGALAGVVSGLWYGTIACGALDIATVQQLRIFSSSHQPETQQ